MRKAPSGGCYSVSTTDTRKISKFEYMVRADTLSGWETAAVLREYLFPYIVYELEAVSLTGAPSDGMLISDLFPTCLQGTFWEFWMPFSLPRPVLRLKFEFRSR